MKRRMLLLPALICACALGGTATAAVIDVSDPRVHEFEYAPGHVYRIVGALRSATQILFAPDEVIEHVALGDSATWEAAPDGEVLFLKPRELGRVTNLIVTTQRAGASRHYTFELVVRSGPIGRDAPDTYFQVRFRYPQDLRDELGKVIEAQTAALEQEVLQLKLERGVLEGRRNLAYSLQGAEALAPSEVSDNGRFTILRFPAQQSMPALYAVGEDGAEALVPFDVRGEFIVIHAVVRELRLRSGRAVLCIFNEAFDPYGAIAPTGTAAGDVDRIPRRGAKP